MSMPHTCRCEKCGLEMPALPHVHLSSGGRDPNERIYTKRDVEALIAVALAVAKQPAPPQDAAK